MKLNRGNLRPGGVRIRHPQPVPLHHPPRDCQRAAPAQPRLPVYRTSRHFRN